MLVHLITFGCLPRGLFFGAKSHIFKRLARFSAGCGRGS